MLKYFSRHFKEVGDLPITRSEKFFKILDKSNQMLEKALNISYLEAFVKTIDLISHNNSQENLKKRTVQQLRKLYSSFNYRLLNLREVHRAVQFILIKAIREDKIQANHQETPDIIAAIMGYIMIRILKGRSRLRLLDVSMGTGNLLITVMNQLKEALHCPINALGMDNNSTLVSAAQAIAKLQHVNLRLEYRDALMPFTADNFDLAVADLPVGYYPLDKNARNYRLSFSKGHSYTHYLLIEQAMDHVRPGGFGEFLIPSNLFTVKGSKQLLKWLRNNAYLQGVLNLPKELFTNVRAQKAILLLQRHGQHAQQAKKVMIGEFPSFKKPDDFQKFIAEIVEWEEHDLLE